MIVYLDTSAFVPILAPERSSAASRDLWGRASALVSTRLLFVEAVSALSRRQPNEKQNGLKHPLAESVAGLWGEIRVIELGENLMLAAANCAARFGLRGYDAVHCAAAASINGPDTVAASSDRRLLGAWSELGLATFDPLQ